MKKKFRVAVEGKTIDGRELPKAVLQSIAKNFDPQFNTARVNMEHFSGWSPEPPFNAYGTVSALEIREEEFTVGGKREKLTTLVAEIDANDQLLEVNKKGQKIFTSIEYWPNFRGNPDEFCLGGLALTDTPASFGTEPLKFTITDVPVTDKLKSNFTEFEMDAEKETAAEKAAESFFATLFKKLEGFGVKTEPAPAAQAAAAAATNNATQMAEMAAIFKTGFEGLQVQFSAVNANVETALAAAKKANDDLAALTSQLENTKSVNSTPRPLAFGGADYEKTTC